jgi:hypothetical protein
VDVGKKNVTRVNFVDDMAGLIGDFDGTVQAAGPFAQKGAAGGDRLDPGGFHIGQILAGCIAGEGGAFTNMEKIAGHELGFAALFPDVTREPGWRSGNTPWRKWGKLAVLAPAPL